jgi:hypothetical protein
VKKSQGFTVLELTLAMAFLSFVLVFISLAVIQMLRIYDEGITMKQINQAGSNITSDLSRLIRTSVSTQDVITTNIDKGVICVGNVAYVWNPLYKSDKTLNTSTRFNFNGPEPISLARWYVGSPLSPSSVCNTAGAVSARAKDGDNYPLLSQRARVLWVNMSRSSDNKLIKITFYLGTYDPAELPYLSAVPNPSPSGVYNTAFFATSSSSYPTCPAGTAGVYCFAATFTDTIYLPNAVQ